MEGWKALDWKGGRLGGTHSSSPEFFQSSNLSIKKDCRVGNVPPLYLVNPERIRVGLHSQARL